MAVKKVTAFVGSARKGHTYQAVRSFCDRLEAAGDVRTEIVSLSDYRIEACRGCKACFTRGEDRCPLADDRDALIALMLASDGVVFASPNYSFQVSGLMKCFLDRLGYVFHRPCFHGKTFTSIVVQGVHGGGKIVKYLDFVGMGLGFTVVKGTFSTAFDPMTAKEERKRDATLSKQAEKYLRQLACPAGRVPGLFELMIFRYARTSMSIELDDSNRDYRYYRDRGWFDSAYYYPTKLGFAKRMAGGLFDSLFAGMSKARAS
ncbi:MAG: hypothetical protein Kow0067_19040 [Coriobacteriia bacterium]